MQSLVTLSGVSFEFPNGRELFNNLSLKLNSGLTALVGANGAGKTTLAKLINGELEPSRGKIVRTERSVFSRKEKIRRR